MENEFIIVGEILLSFFAVVGIVYLCMELIELLKYSGKRYNIPVVISADDYPYEQILIIVKAFSGTMNHRASLCLFDKITILTDSDDESTDIADYLGRYAAFADIHTKVSDE